MEFNLALVRFTNRNASHKNMVYKHISIKRGIFLLDLSYHLLTGIEITCNHQKFAKLLQIFLSVMYYVTMGNYGYKIQFSLKWANLVDRYVLRTIVINVCHLVQLKFCTSNTD